MNPNDQSKEIKCFSFKNRVFHLFEVSPSSEGRQVLYHDVWCLFRCFEPFLNHVPIDYVPNCFHVVGPDVPVVDIVCVLPNINSQ
jgi:hypothetical protein